MLRFSWAFAAAIFELWKCHNTIHSLTRVCWSTFWLRTQALLKYLSWICLLFYIAQLPEREFGCSNGPMTVVTRPKISPSRLSVNCSSWGALLYRSLPSRKAATIIWLTGDGYFTHIVCILVIICSFKIYHDKWLSLNLLANSFAWCPEISNWNHTELKRISAI